jgi:hypothetical protein
VLAALTKIKSLIRSYLADSRQKDAPSKRDRLPDLIYGSSSQSHHEQP